ncbi:BglG family transcription antiterminator [Enterococcus caccae]|uniref:BglG family transcriptional antiterminator n=1 Tax=Enterococcus caccae ATCC BAA-1240 TaxID=1158612 RepID=R3WRJ2_9ENTE|nr:BglG family transcription antiterminator [Enterococcus caccae]EOL44440.1 hypothetical protein UC7_02484 [Enterococcus caccae ATCC BAA-1240]EOT68444.1 hypothetical protein I580_00827 [Enterococcus caccae ATCC BAA-1240]OJG28345.1 hypothetical protein RU98_GL001593 [Enterococcus caccae]
MMDERSRKLMKRLIERSVHEVDELAVQNSLTKRQLEYSLEKINGYSVFDSNAKLVIENNRIILTNQLREQFMTILSDKTYRKGYSMNAFERSKYLYLLMFYFSDEYLSINYFIDELGVGKTTVMNDLKNLTIELEIENIQLVYTRKDGYQLSGNEEQIRYHLMKMIIWDSTENNTAFIYDQFIEKHQVETIDSMKDLVEKYTVKYGISFVENRLSEFIYTFIFLKKRLFNQSVSFCDKYQLSALIAMKEYQFSKSLLAHFCIEDQSACMYLCAWILGLSIGRPDDSTKDYETIIELVKRIIQRFEAISGIRFNNQELVVRQLYTHFRPAYYRLYFKLPIVNPLHNKIKDEYSELFNIVEETLKPIASLFEHPIPEDEIAFLTMHFASLCSNFDEYTTTQKVALIVCPNGIGSSSIVYTELKTLFPELSFLGPVETKEIERLSDSYDLIFSTVPNIRLFYTKKPVYIVSPIMNTREKYRLISDVYAQIGNFNFKLPSVDKIMEIIQKHAAVNGGSALEKELYEYLINQEEPVEKNGEGPGLQEITAPELIQLNIEAKNWEEAIRLSAAPLLKYGRITRNYIDTIVDTAKKEGPYMVISKNVALPHARPIDGVKRLGISISVLKEPLVFGSKENDPVKYIFCLAATENNRHLNAMVELVKLLDDPQFYYLMDNANDSHELYRYLFQQDILIARN